MIVFVVFGRVLRNFTFDCHRSLEPVTVCKWTFLNLEANVLDFWRFLSWFFIVMRFTELNVTVCHQLSLLQDLCWFFLLLLIIILRSSSKLCILFVYHAVHAAWNWSCPYIRIVRYYVITIVLFPCMFFGIHAL